MAEAIKIAVRVRPFNQKEKDTKQELCIEMVSLLSHESRLARSASL